MSFLDPVELPKPKIGPELMMGAASPLWGYFGAAAMGGVAYWWMTQWARPVNLEAFFGMAAAALPKVEEVAATAEKVAEAMTAPALAASESAISELPPVGGEAAPISPIAAVDAPIAAVEATLEAAQDVVEATAPVVEEALETVSDSVAKTTEAAVQPLAEAASFTNGSDPDAAELDTVDEPPPPPTPKGRKSAARDA